MARCWVARIMQKILIVMAAGAECDLGAGSIPLACPGAHRLTDGLPGLGGWQMDTAVWLMLDRVMGGAHLTWGISIPMWQLVLEVACSLPLNKMWLPHK